MTGIPEGMKALRDAMGVTIADWRREMTLHDGRDYADALLAPDGPLWPALRALGTIAITEWTIPGWTPRSALESWGITGPLADACLAAAEVKP